MKRYLCCLIFVVSCAKKPVPVAAPAPAPAPVVETAPVPVLETVVVEEPDFLSTLPVDVRAAVETYQRTGKAPVIRDEHEGFVIFPVGKSRPTVSCRALELCDIAFAPGEKLSGDHALGMADSLRWNAILINEGEGENMVQHVLLKPNESLPLETDIVVGTSRALYHVHVVSGGKQTIAARFYDPQKLIEQARVEQVKRVKREQGQPRKREIPIDLNYAYHDYTVTCDSGVKFCPLEVLSDQHHIFIRLREGLQAWGLPSVYIETGSGPRIVNANLSYLPWMVVDGLANKIILQSGTSETMEKATIVRGNG